MQSPPNSKIVEQTTNNNSPVTRRNRNADSPPTRFRPAPSPMTEPPQSTGPGNARALRAALTHSLPANPKFRPQSGPNPIHHANPARPASAPAPSLAAAP